MCTSVLTNPFYFQSLENFSGQMTLVAHHLEMYMRQIHDTEFPNSVEATEKLLIEQSAEYNKLKVSELAACLNLSSILLIAFFSQ